MSTSGNDAGKTKKPTLFKFLALNLQTKTQKFHLTALSEKATIPETLSRQSKGS